MFIIFLIVGGFFSAGKEFVTLWLGNDFKDVYYYALVYLALSTVPLTINISIEIQRALGKHRFRAVSYLIIAFINVALSVLFVLLLPKQYAIWGCIIGTVFSSLFGIWIIMNAYNKKVILLPIGKYFLNYGYSLLITIFSCLAAEAISYFFVSAFNLPVIIVFLIKGIAFTLCYVFINLVFCPAFFNNLIPQRFKYIRKIILFFEKLHSSIVTKNKKMIEGTTNYFKDFKKHRKNTLFAVLLSFSIPAIFCSSCLLTNTSRNASIDRFSFGLANYIEHNNTNYKSNYLELALENKNDDNFNKMKALYSSLGSSTLFKSQFLTCKENLSFDYRGVSVSDSKIVSLSDYSSYRTSKPEYKKTYRLNYYDIFTLFGPHDYKASSYYGFIYITDVFANRIIEEIDEVNSYDDILYTTIDVIVTGEDGHTSPHTSLITNIVDTEFSTYFKKSPTDSIYFISDDLLNNSTKNDYSLVLQSVFYSNTFSVGMEIKMITDSFTKNDISVDFFTYDYNLDAYQKNLNFSNDFFELYSMNSNIFLGYVFPIIIILVLMSFLVWFFKKFLKGYYWVLIAQLILLALGFLIYSLFNYIYYVWGVIMLLIVASFLASYLIIRRYSK